MLGWLKRLLGSAPCEPGKHRGKLRSVFIEDNLGVDLAWQCERCDTVFLERPEGM